MAIAPLWVSIRTTGAAALGRLSASFRRLGAEIRVAYARFRLAGGIPGWIRRLPAHLRRASVSFRMLAASIGHATRALIAYALASRLAQAASGGLGRAMTMMLPLLAKWAAIGAAVAVVGFPLVGVIGNLIPLVMLLAPAAASAALAFGTLKIATNGFGAALQAGLSGDTEAFEAALKKLAPSAAHAARAIVQIRDQWKPLAREVQQRVFEGAGDELKSLSNLIKPVADTWLPRMANRFAEVRHQLADGLARFAADGRLEAVWRNIHSAVSSLLGVVYPLARVFGDILVVAAPRFAKLADWIRTAATAFSDWIRGAKESGKLGQWLDKAMETFGKLKDILVNVGKVFGAIFKASSDDGEGMLDSLVQGTQRLAEWANGDSGQKMIDTIAGVVGWLSRVGPVINVVTTYMEAMGVFWSNLWSGIKSIMAGVVAWILGGYSLLLTAGVKAFGWIPGLGDKLRAAQAGFEKFKDGVNRALDGIEDEVVNITFRGRKVGDFYVSGSQLSGDYSSGIGGRAVGGPMRAGVTYRINEQGQEFIQLGTSGRAYNARESAAMAAGSGGIPSWNGSMTGLDALFFRWFNHAVRTGKLKPA